MFRRSFSSRRLIALLLPMVFLWSWAACAALCSEIALDDHDNSPNLNRKIDSASDCLTENTASDDCSMTSETVVVSERQNEKFSQAALSAAAVSAFRAPTLAWFALLPEIKQNSPPQTFSSLSLAFLCAFRI